MVNFECRIVNAEKPQWHSEKMGLQEEIRCMTRQNIEGLKALQAKGNLP